MKKAILVICALLAALMSFAQTQQGIVKTRGRMVNGQLVPGVRLKDVMVTLNYGNPLLSGNDGEFSFNVPASKSYSLVSAMKQGYTLADPEYTRRSFSYTAGNPFYVVLEDENQRQADINAARRNIQNTMSAQLRQKENELEILKQQKIINEQEYERRIAELYDAQDKSYELVKAMAERYASTDYDQLDEFNRKVQMYIEEGELIWADSMIRSKGPIETRIEEYYQIVAANKEGRERLEQSESGATKIYVDLSQDLYNMAEIAKQQFEWNEVLALLKKRADLDTTNAKCTSDYADFASGQKNYKEALRYYDMSLRYIQSDERLTNDILHSMAIVYYGCGNYAKALELNFQVASFREKLDLTETHNAIALARSYNNIANSYWAQCNYVETEKFNSKAINIYKANLEKLSQDQKIYYYVSLANLGNLCRDKGDFQGALRVYFEVADSISVRCDENSFSNADEIFLQSMLAKTYDNIGVSYLRSNEFEKSKDFFEKACHVYDKLFEINPNASKERLASVINHLGQLYNAKGDYKKALEHFLRAEELYQELMPSGGVSIIDMASMQEDAAVAYLNLKQIDSAEVYVRKSLDMLRNVSEKDSESIKYKAKKAHIQEVYSRIYKEREQYEKAQIAICEAIDIYNSIYYKHHVISRWNHLIDALNDYAYICLLQYKPDQAIEQFSKALDIINTLPDNIKDNDSVNVNSESAQIFANLAIAHVMKEDCAAAHKYNEKSESAYEELMTSDCDLFIPKYAAVLFFDAACCCNLGDYITFSEKAKSALQLFEKMYAINNDKEKDFINALQEIAGMYNYMNDITQTVYTYSKLIEVYKNSVQRTAQIPYGMVQTMYNLAEVYKNSFQYKDAYLLLSEACDYCRRVDEKETAAFRPLYAEILWDRLSCIEEIEVEDSIDKAVTHEAWEQYTVLYKESPDRYNNEFIFLQTKEACCLLEKKETDKAIGLLTQIYSLNADYVALNLAAALNEKAYEYAKTDNYISAINTINRAISILPDDSRLYDSKGEIFLMQGKNQEALEMWKKVLELNPDFLKDYPDGTELSNGLKKLRLINK